MILCDPPYGGKIDGHATGNGTTKHREFAMGCGEMTFEEIVRFLSRLFSSWLDIVRMALCILFSCHGTIFRNCLPQAGRFTTAS